jgi:alpha-tubulin suppressor-like RCC1 family protein
VTHGTTIFGLAWCLIHLAACDDTHLIQLLKPDAGDGAFCPSGCDWPDKACVADSCVPTTTDPHLATGVAGACAIDGEGALWCWGRNASGELAVGWVDHDPHPAPIRVQGWEPWVQVSSGIGQHYCGLTADGRLWCWGENGSGQLGLGDTNLRPTPTEVAPPSMEGWARVLGGSGHTCALDAARHLYCWGRNEGGELGLGDLTPRLRPVRVEAGSVGVVAVGWGHTCNVRPDGSLWCWGRNAEGQLGLGDHLGRAFPTRVGADDDWRWVATQGRHTCAIRADRSLWCWGDNTEGQLGVGDRSPRTHPAQVGSGLSWTHVSNGRFHTCAVDSEHALWCWGLAHVVPTVSSGSADHPSRVSAEPVWRHGLGMVASACARRMDGSVWCWGANTSGGLGVGDTADRQEPTRVAFDPSL